MTKETYAKKSNLEKKLIRQRIVHNTIEKNKLRELDEPGGFTAQHYNVLCLYFAGHTITEIQKKLGRSYTWVSGIINSDIGKRYLADMEEQARLKAIDIAVENLDNAKEGVQFMGRIIRNEVTYVDENGNLKKKIVGDQDKEAFKPAIRNQTSQYAQNAAGYGPKHVNINIGGSLSAEEIAQMANRGKKAIEGEFEILNEKTQTDQEIRSLAKNQEGDSK